MSKNQTFFSARCLVFMVILFCLTGCGSSGCSGCSGCDSGYSSPKFVYTPTPNATVTDVKCNSFTVTHDGPKTANSSDGQTFPLQYNGYATDPAGKQTSGTPGPNNTITFNGLNPGTNYTYIVNASPIGANTYGSGASYPQQVKTNNCPGSSSSLTMSTRTLTVVVTDQLKPAPNNRVAGAKVTLSNSLVPGATLTGTTNAQGAATFTVAVPPGTPPGSGSVTVGAEKDGFQKGTATAAGSSSTQAATVTVPLARIPGRILPGQ